ncbi:MAG: DNA polymerase III subunit gamma/tau [Nitrospirota bacterium]|nr:DNA polymerase III subunit gamma/tau [Nitrospirota bacterium]
MTYLVLARKWRPQTFDDLTGQKAVVQTLENALATGRVAHAYLFSGVRGVGKTTSARILAKALNCENGTGPNPCGVCTTCREIADGSSIDVIEIDGASNTGVDDVRELRDNVKYAPSRSRYKVFIIDEVHMLSTAAFNALLKTLEEPPPHIVFIFATTEAHKIPATILSRCQHFVFRRIPLRDVVARLRFIVDQEGIEVDDADLLLLARASGGSLRDSLSLLDQAISFCGTRVTTDALQTLLGLSGRELVRSAVNALAARDGAAALQVVRELADAGQDLKRFVGELIEAVRDMVILKSAREPADLLELTAQEEAELKSMADSFTLEELQSYFRLFMKTEGEIRFSAYPRYTLEIALLQAVQLPTLTSLGELVQQLSGGGSVVPTTRTPVAAPAARPVQPVPKASSPPPPAKEPAREPARQPETAPIEKKAEVVPPKATAPAAAGSASSSLEEAWKHAVADVRKKKPQVAPVLEQGICLGVDGEVLTVAYKPEMADFATKLLCRDDVRPIVEEAVGVRVGHPVRLNCTLLTGQSHEKRSLAEQSAEKERQKKERLEREAMTDPLVKSALDIFGGEIVEVRQVESIQE